jgi:polyhydroxybutyrate depolymerase
VRGRGRVAAALAGLVLIAACSSGDDGEQAAGQTSTTSAPTTTAPAGPVPSPGCAATHGRAPASGELTMRSGGLERQYLLTLPEGYDGTTPLPLVFALHSLTVPHSIVPAMAGFDAMHEQYDFVSVAPSGLTDPVPYWIAAPVEPNRDLDFLVDLLDRLEAGLCLDISQVFSTGLSNGGQMSSLLACQVSDRVTAVAPVAGVEFSDLDICAGEPVPVMAFHGDADPVVLYDGGGLDALAIANQNAWHGVVPEGVPEHAGVDVAMANWAEHNGCDPEPVEERVSPEVVRRTWQGCDAETVLYVVEGGGHNLPGHPVPGFEDQFGHTTTDIDATALMFEFFLGPPG